MPDSGGIWSELDLHPLLSEFADTRLKNLVRYWLALRGDDEVPHRGAIDPTRFKDSLDMVWLLERHTDGRFRYRLAGQTITEIHGGIRRGADAEALFAPQAFGMFRSRWEAALDGRIVRAEGIVRLAGRSRPTRLERLMLPLRADDGSVSVVLGATRYDKPRGFDLAATEFPPTNVQSCPLASLPPDASF